MKLTEILENHKPIPENWKPIPSPYMEGPRASYDKEVSEWPLSRCHIMTSEYIISIPQGGPLDTPRTVELLLDAASRDPLYVIFGLYALALQHMGPAFKHAESRPYFRTTDNGRKALLRQRMCVEGEDVGFIYEVDYVLDVLSEAAVDTVKKMCKKIISTTPLGVK
jgi:hypothetical protein